MNTVLSQKASSNLNKIKIFITPNGFVICSSVKIAKESLVGLNPI